MTKKYSLETHKPYAVTKARHAELLKMLEPLRVLRKEAEQAENAAIIAEAEAYIDSQKKPAALNASKKASEAVDKVVNIEREMRALLVALEKLEVILKQTEEEAKLLVIKEARADHEKAVVEVINAARKYSAACEAEREIAVAMKQATGTFSDLYWTWSLLGNAPPGREDVWGSPLSTLLRLLRERGYKV